MFQSQNFDEKIDVYYDGLASCRICKGDGCPGAKCDHPLVSDAERKEDQDYKTANPDIAEGWPGMMSCPECVGHSWDVESAKKQLQDEWKKVVAA